MNHITEAVDNALPMGSIPRMAMLDLTSTAFDQVRLCAGIGTRAVATIQLHSDKAAERVRSQCTSDLDAMKRDMIGLVAKVVGYLGITNEGVIEQFKSAFEADLDTIKV